MANATIDGIVDQIATLSAMDLADLSKAIQEKFGVTAAAPVAMMPGMMAGGGAAEVEEQTEFDVILTAHGEKKIQVIKVVREITGLGLKEAKDLVDGAPGKIKDGLTKDQAESIKGKIEEVGGTVEIK